MSAWYFIEDGERRGPVEREALADLLQSGRIPRETLVWRDGMADWASAQTMPELSGVSFVPPTPPIPSAPMHDRIDPFTQQTAGVMPVTYAGFWKRFVAFIIDRICVAVMGGCFGGLFGGVYGVIAAGQGVDVDSPDFAMGAQIIGGIIGTIVEWLYFALFESSKYQATPGKMALQIQVTNMSGERISFLRATGRHFAKLLSVLTLLIGYFMAGFTEKKQALHDIVAGCLVVNKS